ncbi:MAG TPA: hypothetical protein VEI02_05875 [Planctomycetota bacterium]|nr:hypothetical protein [Planctomycetota bacterium]
MSARRIRPRLIGALLLACVASAPAAAQLGDTYKHRRIGVSVQPPAKWPQVPVEPGEEYSVAKWAGKRDFGNFVTEFQVLAFTKVQKPKPPTAEDAPEGGDDGDLEELVRRYARGDLFGKAGTYQDYWRKNRLWDDKFELPKPTREIKVKGWESKVKIFDLYRTGGRDAADRPARFWYLAAQFDLADRQFVLEFVGGEPMREKLLPLYMSVIESFRMLPAREIEAAEDEEAVAKLTPKQKALRTAELTKRQTPGWWFRETEHYVVLTSLPESKSDLIDDVASRLKKLRRTYEADFPPEGPIEAVSIVRVCKSREEYLNYGAPPSSAGYWNAAAQELVMYVEGQKDTVFAVLSHEAFHQYIYYCFGELSPHSWYNEGYGDYYAGSTFEGSRAIIKPFAWRKDVIKNAIRQKRHVPVKKLVRYSQAEYYSDAQLCYAQGWSLVYFLNKGLPKKHPYANILPTYFKRLRETKDVDAAVNAAFAGVDMDKFEADWAAFIAKDVRPSLP